MGTDTVIQKLSSIPGLDVYAAVKAMGGKPEAYLRVARLTARLMPGDVEEKLDKIKIHGLKGALNGIGAFGLGALAYDLEKNAGREKDYAIFKEQVLELARAISEALKEDAPQAISSGGLPAGDLPGALKSALAAAKDYDNQLAVSILLPYNANGSLNGIIESLEAFNYNKAVEYIKRRLDCIPT